MASSLNKPTHTRQGLRLWPIFRGQPYRRNVPSDTSDEEEDAEGGDSEPDSESDCDSNEEEVDRLERQIDRKNKLFGVDENGQLMWHLVVTSYTTKEWLRRGHFTSRATYHLSSPTELRQYVRNRNLANPYPQGLTLKYFYLRVLDRDDEEKSFRFLDLIPELRNMVYKELLTFVTCPNCPAVHEPCHPEILSTSKQVYKEAKAILYADNEVHCRFTASGPTRGYGRATFFASIHGQEVKGDSQHRLDSIFYGMNFIPDYLRQIQRLHVDVVLDGGSKEIARSSLQSCLLNLASFLMDGYCLKKLRIHIYDMSADDIDDTHWPDTIVYPLRRLRGIEDIELTGVSDALKSAIIADMRSATTPTFNTLKHLVQLQAEAEGYLRIVSSLDPYNGESLDDAPPPPRGYDLSDDIKNLSRELGEFYEMDEEYDPFVDAETELNTRRKMQDLKDCLAKVNLDNLDQRRKEYLDAKSIRKDYLSEAQWVAPEGTHETTFGEIRRNWKPRLSEYDW
jgi:hypothetical protein